ncbi:hypothetical protein WME88_00420 [Sorangium sp. So ce216]
MDQRLVPTHQRWYHQAPPGRAPPYLPPVPELVDWGRQLDRRVRR